MKIKVCGLKFPENIKEVSALNADYMGFIFYHPSPRFVAGLEPYFVHNLPSSTLKTGVFVDETAAEVATMIDKFGFNAIQLHGDESPEFCKQFKGRVEVVKAFGLSGHFDFSQLEAYTDQVDYFLFDTKTSIHGGSGKSFDWNILAGYQLKIPFFLSGGLSLDNLEEIKNIDHPQFYGVDLNSRFEIAAGLKDIDKLKKAFAIIKSEKAHEVRS